MLAAFFSTVLAAEPTQTDETYWEMWTNWHKTGDRFLAPIMTAEEHDSRFSVFKDNVDKITRHNEAGKSWTMGLNQFADMTQDEFGAKVINKMCNEGMKSRAQLNKARTKLLEGRRRKVEDLGNPSSVNWVDQGKVTAVKNQGSCGSCWAFSTTGAIEARSAIHNSQSPLSLSEQELVDCDQNDNGCGGGAMQNGFLYAEQNNGLCLESEYSYHATGGTCMSSSCTHYDPVNSYTSVSYGESYLETAVAAGPVSIAIEADQSTFQFYQSGVMSGDCGTGLDHGVLAVGYDNTASTPYWVVKNSWGAGWGESGYIRMCKDCNKNDGAGQCGLAEDASYPTFA